MLIYITNSAVKLTYCYRELRDITQIEQILKDNSVVILYANKPKRGHWICLIRYIKNNVPTLEFFDSYGFFPDDEKKIISKEFLRNSNQKYNKISGTPIGSK